jgi:hypothetical protein
MGLVVVVVIYYCKWADARWQLEGNLTAGRKRLALSAVIPTVDLTSFHGLRIVMFLPACPLEELFLGARILGFLGYYSYFMFGQGGIVIDGSVTVKWSYGKNVDLLIWLRIGTSYGYCERGYELFFYVHTVHFYCLIFFICTNKCTYIYIIILHYITNAATCFGASAPFSGSLYIVFAKVIKY